MPAGGNSTYFILERFGGHAAGIIEQAGALNGGRFAETRG
jgi:hypothetical protein